MLGFTDRKSNVVIIAVKGFEYSRVHMGVNAIIPASGARLQCPSPSQVSTSSRVLCVVNSGFAQKCKIGMVVVLGRFDLQQGDHEGRCFKHAGSWNPEWEILNQAFFSFLIKKMLQGNGKRRVLISRSNETTAV